MKKQKKIIEIEKSDLKKLNVISAEKESNAKAIIERLVSVFVNSSKKTRANLFQ